MTRIALVFSSSTVQPLLLDFYRRMASQENVVVDVYLNQKGKLAKDQSSIFANQKTETLGEEYDLSFNFTVQNDSEIARQVSAQLYVESNYRTMKSASIASLTPVILRSAFTPFEIKVIPRGSSVSSTYVEGRTQTHNTWKENDRDLLKIILSVFGELTAKVILNIPIISSSENKKHISFGLIEVWKSCSYFLYYLPKQFTARVKRKVTNKSSQMIEGPTWHIAYTHSNVIEDTDLDIMRLENPKGYFLADPFVVQQGEESFCFVEQYDNRQNRGHISVFPLTDSVHVEPRPILVEDFHLSFPFIFSFEGEYYMCPETSKIGEIRLYKAKEFPYEWSYFSSIMKDVSAADTMIFERNGKWWMFTNLDRMGLGTHNLELHIFHSDNPLSGKWTPHGMNPIYRDSLVARNGGLLKDGADLYRVSQMQGFARYGEGIRINRIVNLSEDEYLEVEIKRYVRAFARNSKGNHHMSSDRGTTVLDYFA